MINILGDSSQRHYLRKDNCGNYVKTQKIMEIVKITGKYLHNQEFEELFQENNVSCKSIAKISSKTLIPQYLFKQFFFKEFYNI